MTFDETTTSLVCIFANQFTSGQISCNANVSYGDTCQNYLSLFNGSTSINTDGAITVTIPLILKRTQKNYCYVVYATNSTSSSFIEGSFYCKSGKHFQLMVKNFRVTYDPHSFKHNYHGKISNFSHYLNNVTTPVIKREGKLQDAACPFPHHIPYTPCTNLIRKL